MWLYVPETPPEVTPDDLAFLSLHSGGGMLEEGVKAGLEFITARRAVTVGYCERQAGAAATLVARMEDAELDRAPIWDDSGTLPCELWRDRVAVVTAGIPCQPWSGAGARLGVRDPRWLWPHVARVLRDVRPDLLVLENVAGFIVPTKLDRDGFAGWSLPAGLGVILGDLAEMGWDAEWVCLPASAVGAHHLRWRVFIGAVPRDGAHAERWALQHRREPGDVPGEGGGAQGQRLQRKRGWATARSIGEARPDAGLPFGRPPADGRGGQEQGRDDEGKAADRPRVGRAAGPHAESRAGRLHIQQGRPAEPVPDAAGAGRKGADAKGLGRRQGTPGVRSREPQSPRCGGESGADTAGAGHSERKGRARNARGERAALERDRHKGARVVPCDDSCLPFFALPPQECGSWQERWLVEPAVEPGFCISLHGMALVVDKDRITQLRTSGNGVVALQAAVATVVLGRRLGI